MSRVRVMRVTRVRWRARLKTEYKVAAEAKKRIRALCYAEMFTSVVAIVWGILPAAFAKPVRALT